ncbi:hypothetical protein JCM18694_30270 [Prolixibacter denitrificans]|uniref:6-bladed beta-propeller protein n=2 Tax=Prolixibacter denitrificans TaxID=1541063 RepID=A0ABQ0ZMT8_9BACT|nr:hypothetical protein JCM18694_30270 [Prolixibacter denitrificans]
MSMKTHFKIRLSFLLIPLAALLLNGCQKKEEPSNVVVLEATQSQPLKIGEPKQIIKLETTKESQLRYVSKTAIDKQNNRIFILSDRNVFIFDGKGRFINKLRKGKGPGEILRTFSFSINPAKQLFYAVDGFRRLCVFDYNGKFIQDYHLKDYPIMNVQSMDSDQVLLHHFTGEKKEEQQHIVGLYGLKDSKIIREFIPEDESSYPSQVAIMNNSFSVNGSRLFFASNNIWGLFEWKNNQFKRILSFDIGKRMAPSSFVDKYLPVEKRVYFRDDALKRGYVPWLLESFNFKGYYWAIIFDEKKSCYAIDENNYRKVYMDGPVSAYFGLPEVKSLQYPREMTKNYMVFACSPADFFDADDTETTKTITIGDKQVQIDMNENPFLIVAE